MVAISVRIFSLVFAHWPCVVLICVATSYPKNANMTDLTSTILGCLASILVISSSPSRNDNIRCRLYTTTDTSRLLLRIFSGVSTASMLRYTFAAFRICVNVPYIGGVVYIQILSVLVYMAGARIAGSVSSASFREPLHSPIGAVLYDFQNACASLRNPLHAPYVAFRG